MDIGKTSMANLIYLMFILIIVSSYCTCSVTALISIQPLSPSVFAGDSATFECKTDGTKYEQPWQWFKIKDTIVQNVALEDTFTLAEYEMVVFDGRSKLTILNVSMADDQNVFYCQCGVVSKMATLTVISSADLESLYLQCDVDSTFSNTEKLATFTCSVDDVRSSFDLQWYDGDQPLEDHEFICYDNKSQCAQYQHVLSVDDEEKTLNCKLEGPGVNNIQSCSANLNIPPTVFVSTKSTTFYDGDSMEVICTAETPWRVVGYEWYVNGENLSSTQLHYSLENKKSVLLLSDLDTNHEGIDIRCNVTTSSGMVAGDRLHIDVNSRFDVLVIICFSVGIVVAFVVGLCLGKVIKSRKPLYTDNSLAVGKITKLNDDNYSNCSHEYETVFTGEKPTIQNKTIISSGYSVLKKTDAPKYKEINPNPINLEHSEYMSPETHA